jgi:hypothetical protein
MAKAGGKTSTERFISLSKAKALLVTEDIGPKQAEEMLREKLAAARLPWRYQRSEGSVPDHEFWLLHPIIDFEENATHTIQMFILGGSSSGSPPPFGARYGITVSRTHVCALLPKEPTKREDRNSAGKWVAAEAKRMKAAGRIPGGESAKTEFARELERRMKNAADADRSIRPVKYRHIMNSLKKWGLWPPASIR